MPMTMDSLFDRAHEILDKAQEKVATATSQAAWSANQALVIKNLEGELAALQAEIDRLIVEIGERTYQAWKAHAEDPRVPGMCAHLDDLTNRRAQVNVDLNTARSATYDPRTAQAAWQQSQRGALPAPTVTPVTPTPIAPPPSMPQQYQAPAPPVQQQPTPVPAQPAPR